MLCIGCLSGLHLLLPVAVVLPIVPVYGAAGEIAATTVEVTTVDLGDWTITQSGSDLKFAYQGVDRFKLTSAGALTVENDITAYGSA